MKRRALFGSAVLLPAQTMKPKPEYVLTMTEDERERLVLWLSVAIGAVSKIQEREAKAILDFVDSRLRGK